MTFYRVRRFVRNAVLTRSLGRERVRRRYFQKYLRGDFRTDVNTAYGFKMHLDPSDISISAVISATGMWEPRVSALVAKLVKPGSVVVYVGANIGWFSLLAATRGASSVRAFEPEPTAANLLMRSARTNSFNNIKVEQVALLDRTGFAKLYISDTSNKGLHSIERRVGNSSIDVPCTTLDSSLNEPIDLLKLDIEGSEMRVIEGGMSLVTQHKVRYIIVEKNFELWGTRDMEVWEKVKGLYSVTQIEPDNVYRQNNLHLELTGT